MSSHWLAAAKRVKNCPLSFKQGDRMLFHLPQIVKEECDHVCALAIADLIPVVVKMEKAGENKAKADEIGRSNFCTGCKEKNAFVEFQVSRGAPTAAQETGEISDPVFLETLKELKEFPVFSTVPTRSLIRILPCVKRRRLADGAVLVEKGHRGDHLFVLSAGQIEVITVDANGVETVIATLGKGEVMGEMSLLTGDPIAATLRARGEATILAIEKHDFERLLSSSPALNLFFTRLLAERVKKTSKRFISEIEKGVMGYLNMINPPELIQALQGTARSGLLTAKDGEKSLEIYIHEGTMFRITPGGRTPKDPEEAFYDFLAWRNGTFRFEPGARDEKQVFFKEATSLLLEGMRRADEAGGAGT
jgi:uncharacterized repeat protein (TIGR04076 family)